MQLNELTPKQAETLAQHKIYNLTHGRLKAVVTMNSGNHAFMQGTIVRLVFNRRVQLLDELTGRRQNVIIWDAIGRNAISGKLTRQGIFDKELRILKSTKGAINK